MLMSTMFICYTYPKRSDRKGHNWILPKNPKKLSDKSGTNYLQEISVSSTKVFHVEYKSVKLKLR